jgi:NADH-quinone oxidoreductase subunit C
MEKRRARMGVKLTLVKEVLYIWQVFRKGIYSFFLQEDIVIIYIDIKCLANFVIFLKTNQLLNYNMLLDIWAVDYPERKQRFEVNYLFLSTKYNKRLLLKLTLNEGVSISSLTKIYGSAGWLEREVWDLYGVIFENNSDLRRILTDYGFEGFPLRKDFPLTGYVEVRFDDTEGRIVVEPLELFQEHRVFTYLSPWEINKV